MIKIILVIGIFLIITLSSCTSKTMMPSQSIPISKQESNNYPEIVEPKKSVEESNSWIGDQAKKFIFENCDLSFDEVMYAGTINEYNRKGRIESTITIDYRIDYDSGGSKHQVDTAPLSRVSYKYPLQPSIFLPNPLSIHINNAEATNENTILMELETSGFGGASINNFSISILSENNPNINCLGKEIK